MSSNDWSLEVAAICAARAAVGAAPDLAAVSAAICAARAAVGAAPDLAAVSVSVSAACATLSVSGARATVGAAPDLAAISAALSRGRETSPGACHRWRNSVGLPPACWLLRLADSVCRKATSDLVIQMVADMRVEYFEALNAGRRVKARWITALHYVSIARAFTIDRFVSAILNYVLGILRTGKS